MKNKSISYFDWQEKFSTTEQCINTIISSRWPNGYVCQECGSDRSSFISTRNVFECRDCHVQHSVTAGTIFESTKLHLKKWFMAIFLIAEDKGGISALRLAKIIGVSNLTAGRMLHKIRQAMMGRNDAYTIDGDIELDDAFVGGKHAGKRGRGAEGKTPVIFAVQRLKNKPGSRHPYRAGFMAAAPVKTGVNSAEVQNFALKKLQTGAKTTVHTDGLHALRALEKHCTLDAKATPPEKAGERLPLVHIIIGNFKAFLIGTFHGVSDKYMHEYLAEFAYRFNRRHRENAMPQKLLNLCLGHKPIRVTALC